jgi:prepilin signal peptidase PulO-like enzyme (type II secretory pathway)
MAYFFLVFFLGASIGSFVNVLIDRSIAGTDWVSGRSRCDFCHAPLAWYDLIPLLSFLAYRGKSRCCHKSLSWRHPIIEGLFGALFVWWLAIGFLFFRLATAPLTLVQPVFWLTIAILLIIIALTDLFYGVILMTPVWMGIAWVVLYRIILLAFGAYELADFGLMFVSALGSYLFLWLLRVLTKGRGMGDGDPYLIFLTSLLLSWPRMIIGVLSAFVLGAVVGVALLLTGQRTRQQTMPFGPFIVLGAGVALLWGAPLLHWLYGI